MNTVIILVASLAIGGTPEQWRFVDEAKHGERSVLMFRTVDFADEPAKRLHANDQPPTGARFGVLPLGPSGSHRVAVIWHPMSGALWIDANADGQFGESERHVLTTELLESKVTILFGETEKQERTLILRKRGDGLAYALRGYLIGSLTFGKTSYGALLTDGDADGCFDNPAADRIWIDKNRDGQFDTLTEHFSLGHPVTIGSTVFLVRPDPLAHAVLVTERPVDTGGVTLIVARLPSTKVIDFHAQLISEWGEWTTINDAEKAIALPVGRYRIKALTLRVLDADGRSWHYQFHGSGAFVVAVKKGELARLDVTAGLKAIVALSELPAPLMASLDVAPAVVTVCGLTLGSCERFEKFTEARTAIEATIALESAGSQTLSEVCSGFMCGRLCAQFVRVPATVTDVPLEVVVRFPSGPLAGDLRSGTMLPRARKK